LFSVRSRARKREERALWDDYINRAPYDPLTIVHDTIRDLPEGRVNLVLSDVHSPEINTEHLRVLGRHLNADLVLVVHLDDDGNRFLFGTSSLDEAAYKYGVIAATVAQHDVDAAPGVGGQFPLMAAQKARFILAAYFREQGYRATFKTFPDQKSVADALAVLDREALGRLEKLRPHYAVEGVVLTDIPFARTGKN
jgi:hypothetical protein